MHDFRHRFAIRTLLDWYREGKDVEQQLPALSTYLGHACVRDSYWYLSACPELMEEPAAQASASSAEHTDRPSRPDRRGRAEAEEAA
ncbi:hypothetical protein [Bradyrhizobium vignae]|uniref:hypothetical protein n=1 Tax=Bradyrhizobium vignae TaxID=1549949 RepID=UPI001FCEB21D|nr:hypothetical protein [Bradyrhizobium vignae]